MVPDNNYIQYRTRFLSPKVGDMVVNRFKQTQKQELIKFLNDSKDPEFSDLSTFRGAIVENMIHQLLQTGGNFKCCGPLGSYPVTKFLVIPPSTVNYVSEFQQSPNENIYYRPISSKFPVIDSWSNIGLYQITSAKTRKPLSFFHLYNYMKRSEKERVSGWNVFYLVVIDENFESLTHHKQDISDPTKSKKSKNLTPQQIQEMKSYIEDNLKQYVILVNISSI